ncbi:MAG: hypothetical protein WHU10_11905, partial [Fimbriimonadales bacterium]
MKTLFLRALPVLALGLVGVRAWAVIDFEAQDEGNFPSISATDQGVTATFFNSGSDVLAVWDLSFYGAPTSWGARSIWTGGTSSASGPTTANFSHGLSSISIDFGDFNQDSDTIYLQAFS